MSTEKKVSDFRKKWLLVGNDHVVDFLDKIIKRGDISGSFIFQGPRDLGKFTTANTFAKSLLCQKPSNGFYCGVCPSCRSFISNVTRESVHLAHGDFHVVEREEDKKEISIEQIKDFIQILSLSSFVGRYKIGIIKEAERMNDKAFNALLKTLEEPRKDVVVIMLTDNLERFPETIISRSQVVHFRPVKSDSIYHDLVQNYQVSHEMAAEYARLSLGRPALALKYFQDRDFYLYRQKLVEAFLNFPEQNIAARFLSTGDLCPDKETGQALARRVEAVLDIWVGVWRDRVLAEYGHFELIQNGKFLDKIKRQSGSLDRVLRLGKSLEKARGYLSANVNPKLVLESVAASF